MSKILREFIEEVDEFVTPEVESMTVSTARAKAAAAFIRNRLEAASRGGLRGELKMDKKSVQARARMRRYRERKSANKSTDIGVNYENSQDEDHE